MAGLRGEALRSWRSTGHRHGRIHGMSHGLGIISDQLRWSLLWGVRCEHGRTVHGGHEIGDTVRLRACGQWDEVVDGRFCCGW